jgi:hypothetical protein
MIKTLCMAAFGTAMLAGAAQAAPICLRTQDMVQTDPQKGGASIIFKMRDGSVWRNDLYGSCPDLWFTGFAWTVCENQETLHVLRSAEICSLGKFTQLTPSRAERHERLPSVLLGINSRKTLGLLGRKPRSLANGFATRGKKATTKAR